MQVLDVQGLSARCTAWGEVREASLVLLMDEPILPGDHLLVHRGQALRRMPPDEAAHTLALLEQVLAGTA